MPAPSILFEHAYSSAEVTRPAMRGDAELIRVLHNALQDGENEPTQRSIQVRLDTDVLICGEWGWFRQDGAPDLTLMRAAGWSQEHLDAYSAYTPSPHPEVIEELAVNILWPGVMTYGHWLLDTAARLELVGLAGIDLASCVILLPVRPASYMREIAALFGIQRYVEVGDRRDVLCRRVVTPGHTRSPVSAPATLYQSAFARLRGLRHRISQPLQPPMPRKLYVIHTPQTSRSNDPRRLTNEATLLNTLTKAGFEPIEPSAMSLVEQVETFKAADVVAGVDSSALHNAIFTEPGALRTLAVLSPPWRINYNHLLVAAAVGAELLMIATAQAKAGEFHVDERRVVGFVCKTDPTA